MTGVLKRSLADSDSAPVCSLARLGSERSEAWIDRFALERQHAKDTLVNTSQRFSLNEAFQSFDAERELP